MIVAERWPHVGIYGRSHPSLTTIGEDLVHYGLSNGWTVSLLHTGFGLGRWDRHVEAWAFRADGRATPIPLEPASAGVGFDGVDVALKFLDIIDQLPSS